MSEETRSQSPETELSEILQIRREKLSALQSEWEGSASQGFASRYNELKPGFVKAYELVNEIAAALDASAKIVEETDREIGNQFRK